MTKPRKPETKTTDVLILGTGAAGLRAGIACAQAGVDCTLVSKGAFAAGGASFAPLNRLWGIQAALALTDPSDSPDKHFQEIMDVSLGMCDAELAGVLVNEAPDRVRELEDWGVRFRQQDGRYEQVVGCFCNTPRALRVGDLAGARNALVAKLESPQVTQVGGLHILQLLMHDGACVGAVGVDTEGTMVTIRARATIIACGGGASAFRYNLIGSGQTGEGYLLGYEAGAQLVNMEFVQIMLGIPGSEAAFFPMDKLSKMPRFLNAQGEPFLDNLFASDDEYRTALELRQRHAPFSCRDNSGILDVGIAKEIVRGHGTRNFGVRVVYDGVENEFPNGLEVAPFAHGFNGGLKISGRGATSVPGLYAAGEAAGGIHGADRPSGNMLAAAFVFGARAGSAAAEFAKSGEAPLPEVAQVADDVKLATDRFEAARGKDSVTVDEILRRASWVLWKKGLVIRAEGALSSALGSLHEQEERLSELMTVEEADVDPMAQARRVLDVKNTIKLGALVLTAALSRRESRGAHYREDYPMKDDKAFGQPIILSKTVVQRDPAPAPAVK